MNGDHGTEHIAQADIKAGNLLGSGKKKSESLNKSLKSDLICLEVRGQKRDSKREAGKARGVRLKY